MGKLDACEFRQMPGRRLQLVALGIEKAKNAGDWRPGPPTFGLSSPCCKAAEATHRPAILVAFDYASPRGLIWTPLDGKISVLALKPRRRSFPDRSQLH
jgi:hypothetical protein